MTATHDVTCPGCGHRGGIFPTLGEKGVVRLRECPACRLVFADPALWRNPYEQIDYYDPAKQAPTDYPLKVSATDRDRLATLREKITAGRLLEFGGGVGRTAVAAQQAGFEVTILEESARAVAAGRQYHPELTWVQASDVPRDLPSASFSAVTIFHVLEHIPQPIPLIEDFARVLKVGGFLLVEVPNWGSNLRKLQGIDWHFVLDHHVNYFTRATLARLVEPHGFSLEGVTYRRTFAINETQPWKEPLKRLLCALGFGEILRCTFRRT